MPEATGFTVKDLRKCCLMIYDRCLTDRYSVEDHRHVKMESIPNRWVDSGLVPRSSHMCQEGIV